MKGDLFNVRFIDFQFEKAHFSMLGGENAPLYQRMSRNFLEGKPVEFDSRTSQSELVVHKIIQLQHIATQLPDAFIYAKEVTKPHISTANALMIVVVPIDDKRPVKLEIRQKSIWPIGAKDNNPQKRKVVSLKESLQEKPPEKEDFSQRTIAHNET